MPYIKYRGALPPTQATELVAYESRRAPCYEGHSALIAAARRYAEESTRDPGDQARMVEEFLSKGVYPGLQHVGGVAMIGGHDVRSLDTEIPTEDYKHLAETIRAANTKYREEEASELLRENDHNRPATPEHEQLRWRTRVWINSFTKLRHHVPYLVGDSCFAYLRVRIQEVSGRTLQLVDLYHAGPDDIRHALLHGLDLAERFADMLAVLGYGAARVAGVVSTTEPTCRRDVPFNIAVLDAHATNEPVPVEPGDCPAIPLDAKAGLVVRHVRDGLSASLSTTGVAAYWNAIECFAEDHARDRNLKHIVECARCGERRVIGLDVRAGFELVYQEAGLDTKLYADHRSSRGQIQHGDKHPTTAYVGELLLTYSQLQVAAMISVALSTGLRPRTSTCLSTSWRVTTFSCEVKAEGLAECSPGDAWTRASPGLLPQRFCGEESRELMVGYSDLIRPHDLGLPRLLLDSHSQPAVPES
jgi:hypothetical protein